VLYLGDSHDQVRDRERIRSFHLQASIDLIGSYVTSDFTSVRQRWQWYHITDPQCGSTTIAGGSVLDISTPDSSKLTFAGSNATLVSVSRAKRPPPCS
jgi:hypothetical protein